MTGSAEPGVVLVHGLYHDPRHFDLVAGELRAGGVRVAALLRGILGAGGPDTEIR